MKKQKNIFKDFIFFMMDMFGLIREQIESNKKWIIGIVIACVVIGVSLCVSRQSKNQATDAASQITGITSEYDEPEKMVYDGTTVTGKEVLNIISKYRNDSTMGVQVITKAGRAVNYGRELINIKVSSGKEIIEKYKLGKTSDAIVPAETTNKNYINPRGLFIGKILRNENDVICGLRFVQQ